MNSARILARHERVNASTDRGVLCRNNLIFFGCVLSLKTSSVYKSRSPLIGSMNVRSKSSQAARDTHTARYRAASSWPESFESPEYSHTHILFNIRYNVTDFSLTPRCILAVLTGVGDLNRVSSERSASLHLAEEPLVH